jgi:hypothetical protein
MNTRESRNRQRLSTDGLPQVQPGHAVSTRPDHEGVRTHTVTATKKRGTRPQQRPPTKYGTPEGPTSQALYTVRSQNLSELRKHCARGGIRTAFHPLQKLGTPENIRNPAEFGRCTAQFDALSVHLVHASFLPHSKDLRTTAALLRQGSAALFLPRVSRADLLPVALDPLGWCTCVDSKSFMAVLPPFGAFMG